MFAWAACRVGHQCGGEHIRHNQTVRQAVEYCTIYLNSHVGGVTVITHMCENNVYAQCVHRNAA
jgi:hypothetical protein